MACMVLGSSLPDRNSKKETVTDYISIVTAVGHNRQLPTAPPVRLLPTLPGRDRWATRDRRACWCVEKAHDHAELLLKRVLVLGGALNVKRANIYKPVWAV